MHSIVHGKEVLLPITMIREIQAQSILRKHKKIESWFMSHYGLNLYRGCMHSCAYCDGRAEKYQVDGEFGSDVTVKINAIELLNRELDPARKRKPMPRSFMLLGGGVCDSYQPVEAQYHLARKTLELILKYDYPVHILTKSVLIERDMDLLEQIRVRNPVIVSFSFSSVDEKISRIFEPGVPSPLRRLEAIRKFKGRGFYCGMYMMPVIPFITDSFQMMKSTLNAAKEAGIDFVIFGGMTIKQGRQQDHFMKVLSEHFPGCVEEYIEIYRNSGEWGQASDIYYHSISQIFNLLIEKYKIPKRIPPYIFKQVLSKSDQVIVILEHLDYLLKLKGQKSPFGYAAYSISKLTRPVEDLQFELEKIKGVGGKTANIIKEILETGTCRQYESLI
jgi:DNA repair photolyase